MTLCYDRKSLNFHISISNKEKSQKILLDKAFLYYTTRNIIGNMFFDVLTGIVFILSFSISAVGNNIKKGCAYRQKGNAF